MDTGNHENNGSSLTDIPTFAAVITCDETEISVYIHSVQMSFVFKSTKTRPTVCAANMNTTAAIYQSDSCLETSEKRSEEITRFVTLHLNKR